MKLKSILILVALVAAAVVAGVLLVTRSGGEGEPTPVEEVKEKPRFLTAKDPAKAATPEEHRESARERVKKMLAGRTQTAIPNPTGKKGLVFAGRLGGEYFDGVYRDEEGNPFPAADQKVMAKLEKAFEEDDVETLLAVAEEALKSTKKEVREHAIRSLGWHGSSALVEMTPFLSDPDGEIAEIAHEEWMNALNEIEDDKAKANVIEMALLTLRDQDMISDVAGELVGLDELPAIQVIVNVLEAGAAVDQMQDAYNDITGEDWTGIESAEAWLQENYADSEDFGSDDSSSDDNDAEYYEDAAPAADAPPPAADAGGAM